MLAVGAIAIEAPPEDREVAQGAIESCNDALGQPSCRLAGPEDSGAAYYVRVAFFDAQKLEAQVEIRDRPDSDAKISVRHVAFSPADDLRQRYRALGLVVAAYVVGNPATSEAPSSVETPPPPPPPPPEPEPAEEPPAALSGGADLGGLVGAGLDRGAPRFGVLLRGFARFGELPILPQLGVRLAHRADQPALYWLSGEAGLAVELTPHDAPFGVAARAAFVVERLIAQAEDADEGGSESGGQSRLGGRLGVDLFLRLAPGFWLFGGGDASLLSPRVHIDVAGEEVGEDPSLGWSGSIGLRVAP